MRKYGRISDEIRDKVLQCNDIVAIIGQYVHLSKHGKYEKGLCPFHTEKTPSFTVTPEKQIFYCYGCGKSGTVIQFLMQYEGYSYPEAITYLAQRAHIPITWGNHRQNTKDTKNEGKERLFEAHEQLGKLYHYILMNTTEGQVALQYLRERGVHDKLIEQFQLGYAPARWDTIVQFLTKRQFDLTLMEKGGVICSRSGGTGYMDRFRNRIMFPIWERQGRIVGFSGRVLDHSQPKYLNSPETILFNKSKLLYNLHQARSHIKQTGQIVLFEGFVDVMQAWNANLYNGVATMGTALTMEHVQVLQQLAHRVIICYDGDHAGQAAALKAVALLEQSSMQVAVALLPDELDPDEFIQTHGAEKFSHTIIAAAVTPTKFKLISLRKNHILLEDDSKRQFKDEAIHVIAQVKSPVEREIHLKELALKLQLFDDSAWISLQQECTDISQKLQKKYSNRDNRVNWWNNDRNDKQGMRSPVLYPAYVYAERRLLACMFQDAAVAAYVEQKLGEKFNIDDHAALAAYLYTYYAQRKEPNFSHYIAMLQDERLEKVATFISMTEVPLRYHYTLLDEYIDLILKIPKQQEVKREVNRRKEAMMQAEQSGQRLRAVQIAQEIIALEQQLKR